MRFTCLLVILVGVTNPLRGQNTVDDDVMRSLDEWMTAFNESDFQGIAEKLNYPHVRFASSAVTVWDTPDDYLAARSPEAMARWIQATGWHHSEWDRRDIIQRGPDKVHVAVRFSRYRGDGTLIGSYDSLWILTNLDGQWKVQARSSYAG